MANILLKLRYDGTNYVGWQKQQNGVTVQGVLEDKLNEILGCPNGHPGNFPAAGAGLPKNEDLSPKFFGKEEKPPARRSFSDGFGPKTSNEGEFRRNDGLHSERSEHIKITGCSRTDSGVHAREYICNFHTQSTLDPQIVKRALNAKLPKDIVVLDAEYATDDFHSRYDVKGKTYVYQVLNSVERDPFLQNYAYHVKTPLDVGNMNLAAAKFVGEFDFRAFTTSSCLRELGLPKRPREADVLGKRSGNGESELFGRFLSENEQSGVCRDDGQEKNTVRVITDCFVEKTDNLVVITVTGQSFLHNMVRIIAGTIIKVGQGKLAPDDIPRIIESGQRANAGVTAPAKGLFLNEVKL